MWKKFEASAWIYSELLQFLIKSKSSFRVQECHFSSLKSPNFDHRWVTRVSKSMYFFLWRQCTSCFMNILYFLGREASQNVKVGKYENLGQFFMLIFKNWTAPDDPTKTADMLWYLARIIRSYFQDSWTSAYHEKYILLTSLKFQ